MKIEVYDRRNQQMHIEDCDLEVNRCSCGQCNNIIVVVMGTGTVEIDGLPHQYYDKMSYTTEAWMEIWRGVKPLLEFQ